MHWQYCIPCSSCMEVWFDHRALLSGYPLQNVGIGWVLRSPLITILAPSRGLSKFLHCQLDKIRIHCLTDGNFHGHLEVMGASLTISS